MLVCQTRDVAQINVESVGGPAEKKLNLSISETHAMKNDASADAHGMGGPSTKMDAVFDGVQFVHVCRSHAERGFDNRGCEIVDAAVGVAVNAKRDVGLVADESDKTVNNMDAARDVAWSCGTSVASVLTLFAVLAVSYTHLTLPTICSV